MDIAKARKILEKDGENLSDDEVQEFINSANVLSDIFWEMWEKMTPAERDKFKKKQEV